MREGRQSHRRIIIHISHSISEPLPRKPLRLWPPPRLADPIKLDRTDYWGTDRFDLPIGYRARQSKGSDFSVRNFTLNTRGRPEKCGATGYNIIDQHDTSRLYQRSLHGHSFEMLFGSWSIRPSGPCGLGYSCRPLQYGTDDTQTAGGQRLGDALRRADRAWRQWRMAWHGNQRHVGAEKLWKFTFRGEFLYMLGNLLKQSNVVTFDAVAQFAGFLRDI
jgi:hypothetical protein